MVLIRFGVTTRVRTISSNRLVKCQLNWEMLHGDILSRRLLGNQVAVGTRICSGVQNILPIGKHLMRDRFKGELQNSAQKLQRPRKHGIEHPPRHFHILYDARFQRSNPEV